MPNQQIIRILSALPILGHPRDSKRIAMLQTAGFQVEVAAFERDYHSGRMPTCPIQSLGYIKHGHYVARAIKMIHAFPKMRSLIRRNDVIYASGPDMALFAIIAGLGLRRSLILEVGDIRHAQVAHGWKGFLARCIDRFIVNCSKLLVVTTMEFADGYYKKRLKCLTPIVLMENKLDEEPLRKAIARQNPTPIQAFNPAIRKLRIGYFGVLRCSWSWNILLHIAREMPEKIHVVVAGYCMNPVETPDPSNLPSNFEYKGKYRSPDDLPSLYEDVDLIWACYPGPEVTDPDWRWALSICRSNRFYESCFFQKPLISLSESGDGLVVDRFQIGLGLTDQTTDGISKAISAISPDKLLAWRRNLSDLPKSCSVYTDDLNVLASAIQNLSY